MTNARVTVQDLTRPRLLASSPLRGLAAYDDEEDSYPFDDWSEDETDEENGIWQSDVEVLAAMATAHTAVRKSPAKPVAFAPPVSHAVVASALGRWPE